MAAKQTGSNGRRETTSKFHLINSIYEGYSNWENHNINWHFMYLFISHSSIAVAIHIHHYKYVCTQSLTVHCALSEWVRVHGPWRVCDVSEINSILSNQLTYYLTDCLIRWERLYCHKDTRSVLGVGYPVSVV